VQLIAAKVKARIPKSHNFSIPQSSACRSENFYSNSENPLLWPRILYICAGLVFSTLTSKRKTSTLALPPAEPRLKIDIRMIPIEWILTNFEKRVENSSA